MIDNRSLMVIDLFAGAGGFGLGLHLAGFSVRYALEIDKWATQTLTTNFPQMNVVCGDIRDFESADLIRASVGFQPDIIIGGPPCQGFSIAVPAQKDPSDPRNALFVNFARWVEVLCPRTFVMENVKGLLTRRNAAGDKVIDIIRQTFDRLGHSVEVWVLNAADYGVPQQRERIFVVGNRLGIMSVGTPPGTHTVVKPPVEDHQLSFLENTRYLHQLMPSPTLWEAISDLPELMAGEGKETQAYSLPPQTDYQHLMRGNQAILFNHVAMQHSQRLVERFKLVAWGESSADVPHEHRALKRNGNGAPSEAQYEQNNRRLHPDKPSHTIAAAFYANFIHPFQHRNLTAREGARIQSFPDWYRFMGKKTTPSHKLLQREGRLDEKHLCQYNQIGNAVPPLLAKSIALHLKEAICR